MYFQYSVFEREDDKTKTVEWQIKEKNSTELLEHLSSDSTRIDWRDEHDSYKKYSYIRCFNNSSKERCLFKYTVKAIAHKLHHVLSHYT